MKMLRQREKDAPEGKTRSGVRYPRPPKGSFRDTLGGTEVLHLH